MTALEQLKLLRDPFGREAPPPVGQPVQTAFDAIVRKIDAGAASLVVTGPAGSGKTFLLDMIDRLFSGRGACVRRVTHGDLAHMALGACCDLLLVDEADSLDQVTIQGLLSNTNADRPSTVLFACVSSVTAGFIAKDNSSLVELTLLAPAEARNLLLERTSGAGRADLFEPEALDALIAGSGGSPQLLQSIGGHALFLASYDRSARIAAHHVADALAAHIGLRSSKSKAVKPQLLLKDMFPAKLEPEPKPEPQFDLKDAFPAKQEAEPQFDLEAFAAKPEPQFDLPQLHLTNAFPEKSEPQPKPVLVERVAANEDEEPKAPPMPQPARVSRFRLATAASIAAVVLLSALSLNGSASVVRPSSAIQADAAKRPVVQLSAEDSLRAMERAARPFLPRPIIIALIASAPLEPVSIETPARAKRQAVGRRDIRQAARTFADR
jgi:hypothetical protein